MMLLLCSSVFLVFGMGLVASYPTGAPVESCKLFTANHSDHLPQASRAPYQITVAATSASNTYTVTISGSDTFKGFLVQGRDGARNIIGQFEPLPGTSQTLDCKRPKDSATHVSAADKTSVTLRWKVPSSFRGKVTFRAAIVKTYDTFWDKIESVPFTIA